MDASCEKKLRKTQLNVKYLVLLVGFARPAMLMTQWEANYIVIRFQGSTHKTYSNCIRFDQCQLRNYAALLILRECDDKSKKNFHLIRIETLSGLRDYDYAASRNLHYYYNLIGWSNPKEKLPMFEFDACCRLLVVECSRLHKITTAFTWFIRQPQLVAHMRLNQLDCPHGYVYCMGILVARAHTTSE